MHTHTHTCTHMYTCTHTAAPADVIAAELQKVREEVERQEEEERRRQEEEKRARHVRPWDKGKGTVVAAEL